VCVYIWTASAVGQAGRPDTCPVCRCRLPAHARRMQVCVLSVITSTVLFVLPLGGRCHTCGTGDVDHCVKSEWGRPCPYTRLA
jgi:hypothetical protein